MPCETGHFTRARRLGIALTLCLSGGVLASAAAGVVGLAAPAHAASVAPAIASYGPRTPGNPGAQLTTSMMPPGSPDAQASVAPAGALTARATSFLNGVDVADYQHPNGAAISWSQVKASGQSWAVVKATEGTGYTNPYMTGDAAGARAAGLQLGLYHFGRPGLTNGSAVPGAQAQADYFSSQINGVGGLQLPPTLDLEVTGGLTPSQLVTWTGAFLQRVQSDTGRLPMIYTGPYFWTDNLGSTAFTQYPLWEADYTTAGAPMSFGGWSNYTLWQWTDGYYFSPPPISGIASQYVDRDRFAGSTGQLTALATASTGNVAPFTGTASRASYPDRMLVQLVGQSTVFEMAGLAPVYLPSFADVSGPIVVHQLSAAQFYSLRSTPLDGTWLVSHDTGQVYRTVGGAPLYVTSFAPYGGGESLVSVGQADFDRAGTAGVWSRLRAQPADGTFVSSAETGQVYRVAGGAPVYVSSWSYYGGVQPYTLINQGTLDRAGQPGVFTHLSFTPANGALIADPTVGTFWTIVNGQLTQSTNSGQVFTVEGATAIARRDTGGVWNHLV